MSISSINNKYGISVVVCTYNGILRIINCIDHIINQQTNDDTLWELIIVDNASSDDTFNYSKNHLLSNNKFSVKWQVITETKPGLNHARLCGLRHSKYSYVLFCDDDNYLKPDYLEKGWSIIKNNPKIGILGGCGFPLFDSSAPAWFEKFSHSYAVGAQSSFAGKIKDFPAEVYGAGMFLKKEPLLSYFDSGMKSILSDRKKGTLFSGGDVELCYILQLHGYEVWYSGDLKFDHLIPESRLSWQYYIELKKGIASGSPRLSCYSYILKNGDRSFIFFISHYLFSFIKLLFYYSVSLIKNLSLIQNNTINVNKLRLATLERKIIFYIKSAVPVWSHYFKLIKYYHQIKVS